MAQLQWPDPCEDPEDRRDRDEYYDARRIAARIMSGDIDWFGDRDGEAGVDPEADHRGSEAAEALFWSWASHLPVRGCHSSSTSLTHLDVDLWPSPALPRTLELLAFDLCEQREGESLLDNGGIQNRLRRLWSWKGRHFPALRAVGLSWPWDRTRAPPGPLKVGNEVEGFKVVWRDCCDVWCSFVPDEW